MERGCAVQPWIERVDGVDMVLVGCGGWRAEGGGWRVFKVGQWIGGGCHREWQVRGSFAGVGEAI